MRHNGYASPHLREREKERDRDESFKRRVLSYFRTLTSAWLKTGPVEKKTPFKTFVAQTNLNNNWTLPGMKGERDKVNCIV